MRQMYDELRVVLIYVALCAVTLAAFEPVRRNGFVNYDDDKYVTENHHVRSGLTPDSVIWAFTKPHASNWHPLTWLSHMLDCRLFGLNPAGHHLTSVILHLVNALLLFAALRSMTGSIWPSAFVAAAFAVHPLRVESVAWVAERKDVLSGLFWMLTILAYLRYAAQPGVRRYILVAALFALGLMAKPMLVTLPFVLLLLDYWPLGRFRLRQSSRQDGLPAQRVVRTRYAGASAGRLVVEKTPMFALAAASSVVTYLVQRSSGAVMASESLPFKLRAANAVVSYIRYLGKIVYPAKLAALYPLPLAGVPLRQIVVSLTVLVVVTAAALYAGRRYGYLATGWLWYAGTLVPVIGLVQVGAQTMADRYTYLPSIGVFIAAAWMMAELLGKRRYGKIILAASAGLLVGTYVVGTRLQVRCWRSGLALFAHSLSVTTDNYIMHNNIGLALKEAGHLGPAVAHLTMSLALKPDSAEVHNNLANALVEQKEFAEAVGHYEKALQLRPDFAQARYNLANALRISGQVDSAIAHYQQLLRLRPGDADGHNGLGLALAQAKRYEEAIEHYKQAVALNRDFAQAYYNLGLAYYATGRLDGAIEQFRQVLRIYPQDAEMHCNLGVLLAEKGQIEQAIDELRTALRLNPGLVRARENLENILAKSAAQ
jgi:tetratricopeptide (TPR) repeat protein